MKSVNADSNSVNLQVKDQLLEVQIHFRTCTVLLPKKRWRFHSSKGSSFKDLIKTLSFINKLKKFILPHPMKLKLLLLLILSHLIHLLFVNTKYFSSLKSTIICVILNSEQWTFLHHEVSFWLKFGQNYKLTLRALDVFHLNSSLTTFACTSHN